MNEKETEINTKIMEIESLKEDLQTPMLEIPTSLPKLPIPDLVDTIIRLLESIKPLSIHQNGTYEKTFSRCMEFIKGSNWTPNQLDLLFELGDWGVEKIQRTLNKTEGSGLQLQHRLKAWKAYYDEQDRGSWLLKWWNHYAYDSNRISTVFNVNYYLGLPHPSTNFSEGVNQDVQLRRAAKWVYLTYQFSLKILKKELKSDGGCTYQFNWLFYSTRIPNLPYDYTTNHFSNSQVTSKPYIIVLVDKFMFKLSLNTGFSHDDIFRALRKIKSMVQKITTQSTISLGIFMAQDRDNWYKARIELLYSHHNSQILNVVDKACFVLTLDSNKPDTEEEFSRLLWHGSDGGSNRLPDKSVQLVIFENGKAGLLGEHSRMDGTSTLNLIRYLSEKEDHQTDTKNNQDLDIELLLLEASNPINNLEDCAKLEFKNQVLKHSLGLLRFTQFGKVQIKKFCVSPDAFFQMAIQIAAYQHFNDQFLPTYESVSTRSNRYGRTETCRTVSQQSCAFVRSFLEHLKDKLSKNKDEVIDLFRQACNHHSMLCKLASKGDGVDRHLLGLEYCHLAPNNEPPSSNSDKPETMYSSCYTSPTLSDNSSLTGSTCSISDLISNTNEGILFEDLGLKNSRYWFISTSQLSFPSISTYGWGEVVPEGLGVAYMIKDNELFANVTALNQVNPVKFIKNLEKALLDLSGLFN